MRLLLFTQKVDTNDEILGFFHEWIVEFSKRFENVIVVALGVGAYDLPANVEVHSLGKEEGVSKIIYVVRFFRYISRFRNRHDSVFVHMNAEYAVLGGVFWRIFGRRVVLWRNHKIGGALARVAAALAHRILYTSPFAYVAQFEKARKMPVGVDTDIFLNDEDIQAKDTSILSLGRISPVKNLKLLVEALHLLDARNVKFSCSIYGSAPKGDEAYEKELRELGAPLVQKSKLIFPGGVTTKETPAVYNEHQIFVNLTRSGSFDKTIIEAMAVERVVLTCNRSVEDALSEQFLFDAEDPKELAEKLERALNLSVEERKKEGAHVREYVKREHGLEKLFSALTEELT